MAQGVLLEPVGSRLFIFESLFGKWDHGLDLNCIQVMYTDSSTLTPEKSHLHFQTSDVLRLLFIFFACDIIGIPPHQGLGRGFWRGGGVWNPECGQFLMGGEVGILLGGLVTVIDGSAPQEVGRKLKVPHSS